MMNCKSLPGFLIHRFPFRNIHPRLHMFNGLFPDVIFGFKRETRTEQSLFTALQSLPSIKP
jgi:hypothetical protein